MVAVVVVVFGGLPNILETKTFAGFCDSEDFIDLVSQGVIGELVQDWEGGMANGGLAGGGVRLEGVPALFKVLLYVLLALHAQIDEQAVDLFCRGPSVR